VLDALLRDAARDENVLVVDGWEPDVAWLRG
jgi:hypothetical protein